MKPVFKYFYFFQKILPLFRFTNWWNSKIPPLIAVFFIGLIISENNCNTYILAKLILLILWMVATAAFGYFINDWTDIKEDFLSGRKNHVAQVPVKFRWPIAIILFMGSIGLQILLNGIGSTSAFFSALHLLCFIIYSVPPFRLKKCLLATAILDSIYAHVLPAVIVLASVCSVHENLYLFILLGWSQFITGVRNILLHHLFDRKQDKLAGNSNFANRYHPLCVLKMVNWFLFMPDLLFTALFLSAASFVLVLGYLTFILIRLFLVRYVWINKKIMRNKRITFWLLNDVLEIYFPVLSFYVACSGNLLLPTFLTITYISGFHRFIRGTKHDLSTLYNYLKF